MNMFNTLTQSTQILIGGIILGVGTLFPVFPSMAETEVITDPKPLEVYTGTVQDLNGTESRTQMEGLAGVGGESPSSEELSAFELEKSPYEAKTDALNNNLQQHDESLGDVQRPTYRVPFVHF
ncbi:hypothetical protein [Crocosphaera sp. XPORK-15E]|uniref:hypothetical protein n=1 Tax=Crocosphaera sp. XPORK-15E TaxID=3110247 RepID=UPI002B218A96|nr:hypothetical protein [Crocosphaera sp. XPORK-15E]MEA5532789.1 hypothetical protein [Crocosphaera sp. XPORK-15E]